MKLYIVVLCYRVPDLTIDCLRSLSGEIGRVPGARVGLLENGSGGDATEQLRQAIDQNGWANWVDLFEVTPNRGFTAGNNLLIRPALASPEPPEYVWLLNSDTIVKEHAVDSLVQFMDNHPRAGIAGSRMLWPDGSSGLRRFASSVSPRIRPGDPARRRLESSLPLEPRSASPRRAGHGRVGVWCQHDSGEPCWKKSDSWTRGCTRISTISTFASEPGEPAGKRGMHRRARSSTLEDHQPVSGPK